jgi:hypothetical protein
MRSTESRTAASGHDGSAAAAGKLIGRLASMIKAIRNAMLAQLIRVAPKWPDRTIRGFPFVSKVRANVNLAQAVVAKYGRRSIGPWGTTVAEQF